MRPTTIGQASSLAYASGGAIWLLGPATVVHLPLDGLVRERILVAVGFVLLSLILLGSIGLCAALAGPSRFVGIVALSAIAATWLVYGDALATGQGSFTSTAIMVILLTGLVVYLGLGLTGLFALKDRSLPRWGTALLPVAAILCLVSSFLWIYYQNDAVVPIWSISVYVTLFLLTGISWIMLGLSLWITQSRSTSVERFGSS